MPWWFGSVRFECRPEPPSRVTRACNKGESALGPRETAYLPCYTLGDAPPFARAASRSAPFARTRREGGPEGRPEVCPRERLSPARVPLAGRPARATTQAGAHGDASTLCSGRINLLVASEE